MSAAADRNLLFGILALQMDFISRDVLVAAMNAWVLDKNKPLGLILVEQRALSPERHGLLDGLVAEHLRQHGDAEQSLAALPASGPLRQDLQQITDADLQASLVHVAKVNPAEVPTLAPAGPPAPANGAAAALVERFSIVRPHAAGGLGEVFVALDNELDREVALKEIQPRFAADADCRGRFLLEAQVTGRLEHPGVVPVYGLGYHADGRPYYAMRFINGEGLDAAIRAFHDAEAPGRDPGERALALRGLLGRFVAVCNAVAYAHSRGILHRDLKPQNILLGPYGETLVVDWGLAKVAGRPADEVSGEVTLRPAAHEPGRTQVGSVIGTPAYMSPEQAAGRTEELGPASDVYSLGATLYCLLTGRPPFEEKDLRLLLARVELGEFPPPRVFKPDVPRPLEAICLKAMAHQPETRYRSARALADDIEHWLADEPVAAYAEPVRQRLGRWVRRHKATVVSGVAAAAVLLAAGVAWWLVAAARGRADVMATLRDRAEGLEELTRRYRYDAEMQLAQQAWDAGDIPRLLQQLNEQRPEHTGGEDLRGFEWYYLWRLANPGSLLTLQGHGGPVTGAAFSPDGRSIATASEDKTVKVWDGRTGRELFTLTGHRAGVSSVCFSPDGRRLATTSTDGTAKVWEIRTRRPLFTLAGQQASVCFSPDGRRLATASADKAKVWDAGTGRELLPLAGHQATVQSVCFSPDGGRIVTASWDQTAKVWDARTGRELLTLKGHQAGVVGVCFSPHGRRLATASRDKTAKVWDAGTGRQLLTLNGHQGPVLGVCFSPHGRRIATTSEDKTAKVWDAWSDREALTLKGHQNLVVGVCFSPDSRHLATASLDGTAKVWDARTGRELLTLKGHRWAVLGVCFSPDGRRLATASWDKTAKVWDAHTGQEILTLTGHQAGVSAVCFSPDGDRLATASYDKTAKVWDARTGKEILPPSRDTRTPS